MATIRKRTRAEAAQTDQTCTPKFLADLLPEVDIDPASNSRSHIRARWTYSLEKGLDGLKLPWRGTGFVNWPFSYPLPFAKKAVHEMLVGNCTDLIVLCKLDTGTNWFHEITKYDVDAGPTNGPLSRKPELWLFDDRIEYDEHPDVIEERRLENIEKAIRKGKSPEYIAKITGESTTNFCSMIIHRRGGGNPTLALESVAKRWVQP